MENGKSATEARQILLQVSGEHKVFESHARFNAGRMSVQDGRPVTSKNVRKCGGKNIFELLKPSPNNPPASPKIK